MTFFKGLFEMVGQLVGNFLASGLAISHIFNNELYIIGGLGGQVLKIEFDTSRSVPQNKDYPADKTT